MIVDCPSCARANRVPAARLHERARCAGCKSALVPLVRPVALSSAEDFDELVRDSKLPVLVDFWAAWCGPCRMVGPELEKLLAGRSGRLVVAKVDTDALGEVASRFAIRSIPTLILFRDGREARRISGAMPADRIAADLAV